MVFGLQDSGVSHVFDMHGGRDRGDGTDVAGTSIEMSNNTFLAKETPVVIRGAPEEKCEVRRNWFVTSEWPGAAVRAGAKTEVHDNAYGEKPKAGK